MTSKEKEEEEQDKAFPKIKGITLHTFITSEIFYIDSLVLLNVYAQKLVFFYM